MKVALDISPISKNNLTKHAVRGAGFYIEHLQKALQNYFSNEGIRFIEKKDDVTPDIELIHYPFFEPFFLTLPSRMVAKTVVTIHDLTPLVLANKFPIGIRGKVKWYLQKRALQNVDGVITDSLSSKKDIMRFAKIPQNKIHVVYLAAGEEFTVLAKGQWEEELRKKYNLPEKFLLYVGDVTPNKNLPFLIKTIQQINATAKRPITLVLVGKTLSTSLGDVEVYNGWNKDLVEVLLRAENDPHILRLGFVPTEDLVKIYNIATYFILPSLYEGFGLPVLEAMQSGCPVLTTHESSLAEVAGDAACFIDAYDMEKTAAIIQDVFDDKKRRTELTKKGLRQAKKFTWENTAAQTVKIYKQILEK